MSAPTFGCSNNFEDSSDLEERPDEPDFSSRITGVARLSFEPRAAGEDLPLRWADVFDACGFSPSSLLSWKNVESEVLGFFGTSGGCRVGVFACDCLRAKEPEALVLRADCDLTVRIVALGLGS